MTTSSASMFMESAGRSMRQIENTQAAHEKAINQHEERLTALGARVAALEAPWPEPDPVTPQPTWGVHRSWVILGGWACGNQEATDQAIAFCAASGYELMLTHEWRLQGEPAKTLWNNAIDAALLAGVSLIFHAYAPTDFAGEDLDAQAAKLAYYAQTHTRFFMDGLEAPNVIDRANEITKAMRKSLDAVGATEPLLGSNPNDPLIESSGGVDWRSSFTPSAGGATVPYSIWDNLLGLRHADDHPGLFRALAMNWAMTETKPAIGWVPFPLVGGISDQYSLDIIYRLRAKLWLPVVLSFQPGFHTDPLYPAVLDAACKSMGR